PEPGPPPPAVDCGLGYGPRSALTRSSGSVVRKSWKKSWKVLVVAVLAGSTLAALPVPSASAQSSPGAEPSGNGTLVLDGGEVPAAPREVPADLDDTTDTDGDGVTDAQEASGARNPWPGGFVGMAAPGDPTDPADPDSDDDGLSDGLEIGTDDGNRAG